MNTFFSKISLIALIVFAPVLIDAQSATPPTFTLLSTTLDTSTQSTTAKFRYRVTAPASDGVSIGRRCFIEKLSVQSGYKHEFSPIVYAMKSLAPGVAQPLDGPNDISHSCYINDTGVGTGYYDGNFVDNLSVSGAPKEEYGVLNPGASREFEMSVRVKIPTTDVSAYRIGVRNMGWAESVWTPYVPGQVQTKYFVYHHTSDLGSDWYSPEFTKAGPTGNSAILSAVSLDTSASTIGVGSSVTLNWSSTPTAQTSSCTASWAGGGTVAATGSTTVTPYTTTVYTIDCTYSDGSKKSASKTVTVNTSNTGGTVSFTASPPNIVSGNSTTLSWTTSPSTGTSCTAPWLVGAQSGAGSFVVKPTATTDYVLTCTFSGGGSSTKSVKVSVVPLSITTESASSITSTSAKIKANLTSSLGTVSLYGALYLDYSDSSIALASGDGTRTLVTNVLAVPFASTEYPIGSLTPNKTYYVRHCYKQAYSPTSVEVCSNPVSFTTLSQSASSATYTISSLSPTAIKSDGAVFAASIISSLGVENLPGNLYFEYAGSASEVGTAQGKKLLTGFVSKLPMLASSPYSYYGQMLPKTTYYFRHCLNKTSPVQYVCGPIANFTTTDKNIAQDPSASISVTTGQASNVTTSSVRFVSNIASSAGAGAYFGQGYLQYSKSQASLLAGQGSSTSNKFITILPLSSENDINGLSAGTTYYVRYCVLNNYTNSQTCGNDVSFKTQDLPVVPTNSTYTLSASSPTSITSSSASSGISMVSSSGSGVLSLPGVMYVEYATKQSDLGTTNAKVSTIEIVSAIPYNRPSYTLSGLTANTDYAARFCFKQGTTQVGCSNVVIFKTLTASAVTYSLVTQTPNDVTDTSASAIVSATKSDGSGTYIGKLYVQYAPTLQALGTSAGLQSYIQEVKSLPITGLKTYINGLTPETSYVLRHCLKVLPTDAGYCSPPQTLTTKKSPAPAVITTLQVASKLIGTPLATSATIQASVTSPNGSGTAFVQVFTEHATSATALSSGGGVRSSGKFATNIPNTDNYVLSGLLPNTTYYVRHCAKLVTTGVETCGSGVTAITASSGTNNPATTQTYTVSSTPAASIGQTSASVIGSVTTNILTGVITGTLYTDYATSASLISSPSKTRYTGQAVSVMPSNLSPVVISGLLPGKSYAVRHCFVSSASTTEWCGNTITFSTLSAGGSSGGSGGSSGGSSSGGGGGGGYIPPVQQQTGSGAQLSLNQYFCTNLPAKTIKKNKKTKDAQVIQDYLNYFFAFNKIPNYKKLKKVSKLDPSTQKTLKRYQSTVGIRSTGVWDIATRKQVRTYLQCK